MIRVRIVDGAAIDVEDLRNKSEKMIWGWNFLFGYWKNLCTDRFRVVKVNPNQLPAEEGEEYLGYPFGNGKICLIRKISGHNMIA